jgi:exosome complex component RRP43
MADPAASVRALFPGHYLQTFLAEGVRPDARTFGEPRQTACTPGVISSADGSASVQVGGTSVVAGVQLSPFSPPALASTAGRLVVVVDMAQAAASQSAARADDDQAVALSDFVTRTLQQARAVDDGDLIIKEGAAAWAITLSITCLNFDGNIVDAVMLAALAALLDTRIPAVELSDTGAVVECNKPAKALVLRALPVCLTLALFENLEAGKPDMVVDPTAEEEKLCKATVTVVVSCAVSRQVEASATRDAPIMVHKAGGLPVAGACLEEAIQHARKRASLEVQLLQSACSVPGLGAR